MSNLIYGGVDIAMKVPTHQYEQTIAFYRDIVGLPAITNKAPAIGFELGPNKLWIGQAPMLSQAEIWLEFFTPDFDAAATHLGKAGVARRDEIEPLAEGFRGGWISSPANIIHMVREPDAW